MTMEMHSRSDPVLGSVEVPWLWLWLWEKTSKLGSDPVLDSVEVPLPDRNCDPNPYFPSRKKLLCSFRSSSFIFDPVPPPPLPPPRIIWDYETYDHIFIRKSRGELLIIDDKNNPTFYVNRFHTAYHKQFILLGPNREIIALLSKKCCSLHGRWNVYKGDSTNDSDLLFSIGKASIFNSKTLGLAVGNKQNDNEDFKIKGSWTTRTCSLYKGTRLLAEMKRMEFTKDKFKITIHPNVDAASVISVFAIIEVMNGSSSLEENHHHNRRVCDEAHMAQAVGGVAEGGVSGLSEFVTLFQG